MSYIGQQTNQQSLNGIIDLTDGTITIIDGEISNVKSLSLNGELNMNINKIINLKDGDNAGDAVNKSQLDAITVNLNDYVRRDGTNSMLGNLNLNSYKVVNLATGTANTDAVNKLQMDNSLNLLRNYVNAQDAVLINYTDSSLNLLRDYVDTQNTSLRNYTDSSLNLLRDYVNTQDTADRVYVDASLNFLRAYVDTKDTADRTYVDASLNLKVNRAGDTITGILNLNDVLNSRNIAINPKQETYNAQGGAGFKTRYNYVRFNYGRQWCISPEYDNGTLTSDDLVFRNGSGNQDLAKFIIGNNYFYIANNVGIGTTTPTVKLDVSGTMRATGATTLGGTLSVTGSTTLNNTLTTTVGNVALCTTSGNVGIGTTTPVEKLEVKGNGFIEGNLSSSVAFVGANTNKQVNITNNNNGIWFNPRFSASAYNPLLVDGDKGMIFSNGTKETGNILIGPWSDSQKGIKILGSNAYVGINKTPTEALDVNGNMKLSGTINRSAWSSGEIMKTQIYGVFIGASELPIVSADGWKEVATLNFTCDANTSISDTKLFITFNTSYYFNGYDADRIFSKISDTTGTEQVIQITQQYYRGEVGGGSRSGTIFPLICQYTPINNTTTKSRVIKIYCNVDSLNDTLYVFNNGGQSSGNSWHAEVKQVKT